LPVKVKKLSEDIADFFQNQNFTVISTIDSRGCPHNSCKGIVKISRDGLIYLLDLYKKKTYENLRQNPCISVTAVDEHKFAGYCLKGKAKIITDKELEPQIIKAWEKRINNRITRRIIKNIQGEKGHPKHPEALFPKPEYLIVMQVEEIIDLTPQHISEATPP
jgi:general stress protein 26